MLRPAGFSIIAFLAGQHGFGIFVPYLGVFLVVACALRNRRQRSSVAEPIVEPLPALA